MKTRLTLGTMFVCISTMIGACDQKTNQDATSRGSASSGTSTPPAGTTPAPAKGAAAAAGARSDADNTARNSADRDAAAKSPMDQSNSTADIKTTADIRRAIMDDKSLSVNAKNCKIITEKSGMVTLRGPVASQVEKDSIEAKAKAIAGEKSVVNELEVKLNS